MFLLELVMLVHMGNFMVVMISQILVERVNSLVCFFIQNGITPPWQMAIMISFYFIQGRNRRLTQKENMELYF